MDFIKEQLVKIIIEEVDKRRKFINYEGCFYFDEQVEYKNSKPVSTINRIDNKNAYSYGYAYPITLLYCEPKTLLTIYDYLKNNKIYFFRKIEGKMVKARFTK